jgi:cyanophycinase-like exopeptidase
MDPIPGSILLFGSGETSPSGRKVFDHALQQLPSAPRIALLETPAGFELNSARVIGRVAEFIQHSLQNFNPQLTIIPARKRGTPFSPDEPEVVAPILEADLIFMGPGSPTYAVRQLRDSLAWHMLIARHRLGATLALASAATIAFSACALPVYEIYKVGEDLHWKEGLDFFGLYGLNLVFVPHWNNQEGGADLDTSRCFMGKARFAQLMEMLPIDTTVIGLDEKTALLIDPSKAICQVIGNGSATLLHSGHLHHSHRSNPNWDGTGLPEIAAQRESHIHQYHNKESFPLAEIGPFRPYHPEANLPVAIWEQALRAQENKQKLASSQPPEAVLALVQQREQARTRKDWTASDALREQISDLGWQVMDTKDGPVLSPA